MPVKKKSVVKKKRTTKKKGATRKPEQGSSNQSLIIIGILVATFAAFLVYLDNIPTEGEPSEGSLSVDKENAVSADKQGNTQSEPKHKFDFYTVLPDREVKSTPEKPPIRPQAKPIAKVKNITEPTTPRVIKTELVKKDSVKKDSVKKEVPKKVTKKSSSVLYQLQVGAFRELAKADAMKARLALIAVEANIQVVHKKGHKIYRVRVGPSMDSDKINKIKSHLKAQNINTFVQKLSG